MRLRCKRWTCPACAERRKQNWAARLWLRLADEPLCTLYVYRGSARKWKRVYKAVQAAGGKYFAVRHGPERRKLFVLATVPLPRSRPVHKGEGFTQAVEALRQVRVGPGKPVSASRGWLPPSPYDWKTDNWRRVGPAKVRPENVMRQLGSETILEPNVWPVRDMQGYDFAASWLFRPDATEVERQAFRDRLFQL